MKTNQLHINLNKYAHMYFRPNLHYKVRLSCARTTGYDQGLILSVNGQKVKKADKVKFLGVIIFKNLTWDDQIKHLENKLLATIVLIKRVKKFIPSSHYLKIYQSLFVSHLTYGISCWGAVYDSKQQKLFKIQNLKDYALEHTKALFNQHILLTLHNLYASRSLVELIKILKLHSPYPVY